MKRSTAEKLFGQAAFYLSVIDTITPIALNHEYTFVSDEWFAEWRKSETSTVERVNLILALELIDKAHLAAVTALMRAKRWADATCLMHDNANFVGWAASVRGLLESAGDTVDGLLNIPLPLAEHHRTVRRVSRAKRIIIGLDTQSWKPNWITLCRLGGCEQSGVKATSSRPKRMPPMWVSWSG
jgi:hypothetical protein